MVLYVGCSNCRNIVPLLCAGGFMPQVPVYVSPSPAGLYCGWCGPLAPMSTCTLCWTQQWVHIAGVTAPPMTAAGQCVAPAVQAGESAGQGELGSLMAKAAGQFVSEFAKSFGSSMGANAASAVAAWWGSDDPRTDRDGSRPAREWG